MRNLAAIDENKDLVTKEYVDSHGGGGGGGGIGSLTEFLWTNPNPTASFAAQTLTFNGSYDAYIVSFLPASDYGAVSSVVVKANDHVTFGVPDFRGGSNYRTMDTTGSSIAFSVDSPGANKTIPRDIWGIKYSSSGGASGIDVLYDNDTGSSGPITLSNSIANYDHMRIYYGYETYARQSVDVYNPSGKQVSLFMNQSFDGQYQTIQMANAVASGTTLTLGAHAHFETNYAAGSSFNYTQTSRLRVYRVEAWNESQIGVVPTGTVSMFAGTTAPTGYLLCQGQAVSRSTYAPLFAVIGTAYGSGDGSTTFNLPNLQGKFALGKSSSYALGSSGGASTVKLTTNQIPAHTHGSKSLVGSLVAYSWDDGWANGIISSSVNSKNSGYYGGSDIGHIQYQVDASHEHDSVGGGASHNNMPPYQTVNYIIKT